MRHLYGVGSFEYLAARPEQAAIFDTVMAESTSRMARSGVTKRLSLKPGVAALVKRARNIVDIAEQSPL